MKNITLVGMHATLTQDKFVIWNQQLTHQSQVSIALHFQKPFISTLILFQKHISIKLVADLYTIGSLKTLLQISNASL